MVARPYLDDLVMVKANYGAAQTRFYRFTGSGSAFSLTSVLKEHDPAGVEDHMVVGDFDNDGAIDDVALAQPGGNGTQVYVFRNGGSTDAAVWSDTTDPALSAVEGRLAVADLDGE